MYIRPDDDSFATFCDILTGYRMSKLLTLVLESNIIEFVACDGIDLQMLVSKLSWNKAYTLRLINVFIEIGFLNIYENTVFLSMFSRKFLYSKSEHNKINTIKFEKRLFDRWQNIENCLEMGSMTNCQNKSPKEYKESLHLFLSAMNEAGKERSVELWDSFVPKKSGIIFDIAAGSGAYLKSFLEINKEWKGVFIDLPDVVKYAQNSPELSTVIDRISFIEVNLYEDTSLFNKSHNKADILLYSNFIHCHCEEENKKIFKSTLPLLKETGQVIVHDFFIDQNYQGATYDIHMMLNTYNGRTYSFYEVSQYLKLESIAQVSIATLPSKSSVLFASKSKENLINIGIFQKLKMNIKKMGFLDILPVDPKIIPFVEWVQEKCKFGCEKHGKSPSCPPNNNITAEKMRKIIEDYSNAVVIVGEPPLKDFQNKLLNLEKYVFLEGFHKTMVYGSGPCSICKECLLEDCKLPNKVRPSLEACGCDVHKLAKLVGISIKPLKSKKSFVKYIAMLLIE